MFVLRKISGSGVEMNISMGDGYTLISKELNKDDFDKISFGEHINKDGEKEMTTIMPDDCIYGYIVCNGGSSIFPLSSEQRAFVMTESGKTFSNVSKR